MGTLPVVVVQITRECGGARLGGQVGPAIGPLAQQRLDEALRLAIGPRRVGPRSFVLDGPGATRGGPELRAIAIAVIGEHAPDADPAARKPAQRATQKPGTRMA